MSSDRGQGAAALTLRGRTTGGLGPGQDRFLEFMLTAAAGTQNRTAHPVGASHTSRAMPRRPPDLNLVRVFTGGDTVDGIA